MKLPIIWGRMLILYMDLNSKIEGKKKKKIQLVCLMIGWDYNFLVSIYRVNFALNVHDTN